MIIRIEPLGRYRLSLYAPLLGARNEIRTTQARMMSLIRR